MNTSSYKGVEQHTQSFLESLQQNPGPPIYTLTPEQARGVLSGLQASFPVEKLPADIENRIVPGGPNSKDVSITIVRPRNSSIEPLPVVVFTHGCKIPETVYGFVPTRRLATGI